MMLLSRQEDKDLLSSTIKTAKSNADNTGKCVTMHLQCTIYTDGRGYYKDFTRTLSVEQTTAFLTGDIAPAIEAYGMNPHNVEDIHLHEITITFDD